MTPVSAGAALFVPSVVIHTTVYTARLRHCFMTFVTTLMHDSAKTCGREVEAWRFLHCTAEALAPYIVHPLMAEILHVHTLDIMPW